LAIGGYRASQWSEILFYTNGTEQLRLTSSSLYTASGINVGFGTSSPAYKLDVNGTSNITTTAAGSAGDILGYQAFSAGVVGNHDTGDAFQWKWAVLGASGGGGTGLNTRFSLLRSVKSQLTNGETLTVDSLGYFGINTANATNPTVPRTFLDVRGSNVAINVTALDSAQGQAFIGSSTGWGIDVGGTLALGGTQNSGTLTATYASISGRRESTLGYIYTGYMQFGVSNGTNVVERARIDSAGNFLVNTTTTGAFFDGKITSYSPDTYAPYCGKQGSSGASVNVAWNAGTTGDNIFEYFVTEASPTIRGTISYNRAGGLVAYNVTSDYRAKDISGPVTNSGALIDSVPVYMGKMKDATQERPMFIAHETPAYAHTGIKDAVDKDGKPVYQQMDASALIPVMWAEIQSLRARVLQLETN
jgi:hypothetical protein